MTIPATLYLANSSQIQAVHVDFVGQQLVINEPLPDTDPTVEKVTKIQSSFEFDELALQPVLANLPRELVLPSGAKLVFEAKYGIERYFQHQSGYQVLNWLEKNKYAWLLALLLTPIAFYWLIKVVIPAAARSVTPLVPYSVTAQIDEQVLYALDKLTMEPTELSDEVKQVVTQSWQQALSAVPNTEQPLALNFRASETYGANAFALPGGNVVITDELAELLHQQPEAITAIFLHEIAHVEYRHGLQMVAEATGVSLLMTYFFGDLEGAAEYFSGAALTVIQNQFSQDLETEADSFALEHLKVIGIKPSVFADALSALAQLDEGEELEQAGKLEQYLSTHPSIKARVDRALAASD